MSSSDDLMKRLVKEIETQHLASLNRKNASQETLVLLLHQLMLSEGFECIGLEEQSQPKSQSSQSSQSLDKGESVPLGWNKSSDVYTFKYRHSALSSFTFVLKILTLGRQLLVHASTLEHGTPCACDINIGDYVKDACVSQFLQESSNSSSASAQKSTEFISCFSNLQKLELLFKSSISRKLVPALAQQQQQPQQEAPPNLFVQPQPQPQPSYPQPQPQFIFDDNDPLRIGPVHRPRVPQGGMFHDPYGFGVGGNDLFPDIGPPMGVGAPRRPGFGGTGNLVGPNNPIFGIPHPHGGPFPSGVPPGARFDPYGPPNPNAPPLPNSGGRGHPQQLPPRGGRGRGRGNPNQFGPDSDHHTPPDSSDNPYFF